MRADRKTLRFYAQFIRPGDLVFDVGANVGIKTKTFMALDANVVCVEPNQVALAELRAVFGRYSTVKILGIALGAMKSQSELFIGRKFSGLSTLSQRWMSEGRYSSLEEWEGKHAVEVDTLDDLITEYGKPTYCKIDVEGYEAEVLKGLTSPLPLVSFEFHGELREEALESIELIRELGEYEFNVVRSIEGEFEFTKWISQELAYEWLKNQPSASEGEIFARLKLIPQAA